MYPTRVKTENPVTAAMRLQQQQALAVAELANKTARVCTQPPKPNALNSAVSLAGAALTRSVALQTAWMNEWADWVQYAQSIQGADTTAKYADRMGNIVLRAEAQVTNQISQTLELVDNITVSYGYWLTQQLEDKS